MAFDHGDSEGGAIGGGEDLSFLEAIFDELEFALGFGEAIFGEVEFGGEVIEDLATDEFFGEEGAGAFEVFLGFAHGEFGAFDFVEGGVFFGEEIAVIDFDEEIALFDDLAWDDVEGFEFSADLGFDFELEGGDDFAAEVEAGFDEAFFGASDWGSGEGFLAKVQGEESGGEVKNRAEEESE